MATLNNAPSLPAEEVEEEVELECPRCGEGDPGNPLCDQCDEEESEGLRPVRDEGGTLLYEE